MEIEEEELALLVNKIRQLINSLFIQPELASLKSRLASLTITVERLEKKLEEQDKQLRDISLALKGTYELVGSIIDINKRF